MPLGPNTLAFFKKLQKEEPTKPMSEFSVAEARETLIPGFADLSTPFPDNAQEKDFIRHEVILPSGKGEDHRHLTNLIEFRQLFFYLHCTPATIDN